MKSKVTDEIKAPPHIFKRLSILVVAGIALYLLLPRWPFLASPSERFHAIVPLLWLLNAILTKQLGQLMRGRTGAILIGTLLGAIFFFWNAAAMQAQLAGGRSNWVEPLYKTWLVLSCLTLYGVLYGCLTWLLRLWTRAQTLLTKPRGWWLRLPRVAITILLFAPYLFTTFNVHRFKTVGVSTPQSQFKLPYESVRFRSAEDDVALSGWFIPRHGSDKVVVVCHGLGANKSIFLGVAPFLHRAGFNILMFDFRGHGDSAGHTISFGTYEARDVRGAVSYLAQERGFKKIALYGFSMGGAAVLHSIGDLPNVRGVVVDSTFSDFAPIVQQQFGFLPMPLQRFFLGVTDFYSCLELGASTEQMSSRAYLPLVSPRPLLIIHGQNDKLVPYPHAQANLAAARQPKTLWLVAGAGHCECRAVEKGHYEARVTRFRRGCFDSGK